MNKHTRLAAGILVLVLVILIVATVSFSVNISKKSATAQSDTSDAAVNPNGNTVIQGDDGLYGVADAAGNTLAHWLLRQNLRQAHFRVQGKTGLYR